MNIDSTNIEQDITDGTFRQKLQDELIHGFQQLHASGERLPPPSYLATQIAEIVNRDVVNRDVELSAELKYELYQETLAACEHAWAEVLGEKHDTLAS
jgi:hypothetical protein